jgi:hypothetical protein
LSYHCMTCGKLHDDLPDIGAAKPDHWFEVPEEERDRRTILTSDACIIDGEDHFIRGVIQIRVHEQVQPFGFGVWVSQKKENFLTYVKNFDSAEIGPYFGWLCTRLRYYPQDTLGLKSRAVFQSGNRRPLIELEPTEHPLAVDQRDGISLVKAWEIVHFYEPKA